MDSLAQKSLKIEIINFLSILPEIFSDDLDRKTLWERIGNGVKVSISKAGGNFENFINSCIEYIKADPGKVAACENLEMFLQTALSRPDEWKAQFLRIMETRYFILIVSARTQWNQKKEMK
jgi:hypothetical protein